MFKRWFCLSPVNAHMPGASIARRRCVTVGFIWPARIGCSAQVVTEKPNNELNVTIHRWPGLRISATAVVPGVDAVGDSWIVRAGRGLIRIAAAER